MQHGPRGAIACSTDNAREQSPAIAFEFESVKIGPGERRRLEIPIARLPTHALVSLPVTVIQGTGPGPRLWLSAAIHGDELNGVEIIRRVLNRVDPQTLQGTLIAVPIVNVFGFLDQSRYLPDRRDLNRSFPGSVRGSLAARLARLFMERVVKQCTHGIDLHTASHHRVNLPQIRANLSHPETRRCAQAFGAPLMIHAAVRDGSLRQAAANLGIPVLLYEGGEALRFDEEAIAAGVTGILRVMAALEMQAGWPGSAAAPSIEIQQTRWVRSPHSGILHRQVKLGQCVQRQQVLGYIADAFGDSPVTVRSPWDGIVIGCTRNPLVHQGDGIFHLALQTAHSSLDPSPKPI